jgi:hypothetical protein
MASDEELRGFVKDALGRGVPRHEIEGVLHQAGWRAEQVRKALATFAEVAFPVPVPRPAAYLSPRDAFVYLVLFSALYLSAFHLGSLLFQFINLALPDPAEPAGIGMQVHNQIRLSVAFLVVAFPAFLYMSLLVSRGIARDPVRRQSRVRQWLTYLTLFVASAVLTGDAVALIYNLLSGGLATRFLLKVLAVGLIAGAGFGWYLRELRQDEREADA